MSVEVARAVQIVMPRHDVQVVAVAIDRGRVVMEMARVVPDAGGVVMPVAMAMPVPVATVSVSAVPVTAVMVAAVPVAPATDVNPDPADVDAKPAATDDAAGFLARGHTFLGQVQRFAARHIRFSVRGESKVNR